MTKSPGFGLVGEGSGEDDVVEVPARLRESLEIRFPVAAGPVV